MKEHRKSIWVQLFLANKYMHEYLKQGALEGYGLTSYDYFLLLALRVYENLSFYEVNKHFPIDVKSLHNRINILVEKGFMTKAYDDKGTSILNLTVKARIILREVMLNNCEAAEEYFTYEELLELHKNLFSFNNKMREILGLELTNSVLEKENLDLM